MDERVGRRGFDARAGAVGSLRFSWLLWAFLLVGCGSPARAPERDAGVDATDARGGTDSIGARDSGSPDGAGGATNDAGRDVPFVDAAVVDAADAGGIGGTGGGGTGGKIDAATPGDAADANGATGPCAIMCATSTSVTAAHLVADPARGRVYVSVPGNAPSFPNQILVFDAATGNVITSVAAGSDPNVLALSDDGSTLWAGIDGAISLRKFAVDVTPPVAGPMHSLSPFASTGSAYGNAGPFAVLPGEPNSIASPSLSNPFTVLDDGVVRERAVPSSVLGGSLTAGPPGLFFSLTSGFFNVYTIGSTSATAASFSGLSSATSATLTYLAGRIYASTSEVIDVSNPAAPQRVGRMGFAGPYTVKSTNRLLAISTPDITLLTPPPGQLRLLDTDTFTAVASVPVPLTVLNAGDVVSDFAYAGGDTIAMLVSTTGFNPPHVVFLRSALVGEPAAGEDADAGSGAGDAGAGNADARDAAADPCPGCVFTKIAVQGRHMVYDSTRARLYAIVTAQATQNPNTLAIIDPAAATVTASLPIGANPTALALSDDASTVWVGLTGDHAIRKVDMTTTPPTVAAEQPVAPDVSNGVMSPIAPLDMSVLPGSTTSVALTSSGAGSDRVRILDDGVPRPAIASSLGLLVGQLMAGPPGYLFGYDVGASSGALSVFTVDASGATLAYAKTGLMGNSNNLMRLVGQRIYAFGGEVIDVSTPTAPARLGRFDYSGMVAARDANHILMVADQVRSLSGWRVMVFEPNNFTPIASVSLPSAMFPTATFMTDMAYLGGDRIAFIMSSGNTLGVYVVEAPVILTP